jgi:hypothetical protein
LTWPELRSLLYLVPGTKEPTTPGMELNGSQEQTRICQQDEMEAEMDHSSHRAGTVKGCKDCDGITYEPSWYATLLAASQERRLLVTLEEEAVPAYS